MIRQVDHSSQAVAGYLSTLSARPGDVVRLHASATESKGTAQWVRLDHDGVATRIIPLEAPAAPVHLAHQSLPQGSFLELQDLPAMAEGSVSFWFQPTRNPDTVSTLVSWRISSSVELRAVLTSELAVVFGDRGPGPSATSDALTLNRWYLVVMSFTEQSIDWAVHLHPKYSREESSHGSVPTLGTTLRHTATNSLLLGADNTDMSQTGNLDGRLARPAIFSRKLTTGDIVRLGAGTTPAELGAAHSWILSDDMAASHSVDRVKHAPLVYANLPTRAVTGPFWTGDIDDWRIAPLEYDAVHLHSDDLEDARWPVTVEMEVPMDACPGVIALEVSTTAGRDVIPLLVRSKVDSPSTPALFLAPTLTWLAYALEHSPAEVPAKCRETAFEFGRDNALNSLYDRHLDGSGVSLASTRRPLLGMRHGHKFRASGFEHTMSADLQIVGWLMRQDVEFDIAADHDLHDEGSELLDQHRVIVTGSHPEYWTTPMRSALSTWLDRGGRMMYLGGNGFYWVTAIDPERPHVVELRRDMNGIRTWAGRPGEAHMSATGEPGGLWRNRGASESALSGVRTRTMGFSSSAPYRRTEASHDPRVARIFEGVESDAVIGDRGLVMGGAAGYETDAADYFDGTPAHALVIASCTELPADYLLDSDGSMTEEHPDERPRARADMVFFETRCDGAVFSVGSVTWGGSLPIDGDKNHVSRITANVLRWFTQRSLSDRDDATD